MYHSPSAGKGDKPRPMEVSTQEFRDNWDLAFHKKKKPKDEPKKTKPLDPV